MHFKLCKLRERERERESESCCSTYLYIHWLILVCALTGDQTCNPSILRRCSNQLSCLASAKNYTLYLFLFLFFEKIFYFIIFFLL